MTISILEHSFGRVDTLDIRVDGDGFAKSSACRLEETFCLVVAVLAMKNLEMEVHLQVEGQGLEELLHQFGVESPSFGLSKLASKTR